MSYNYRPKRAGYAAGRRIRPSRYSSRKGRSTSSPKNWGPFFMFVLLSAVVVFVLIKVVHIIFDTVRSEQVTAEIQIQKGKAEYYFAQKDEWTTANAGLKFIEGDSIRTSGNSKASLQLFSGNTLFLNENTEVYLETLEEKSSGRKTVRMRLKSGEIWVKTTAEDFLPETKSSFQVVTDRSIINVNGTIFDLYTDGLADTISLLKGHVSVDIPKENPELDPWTVEVEVGQKLIVSNMTIEKLKNGSTDVKEIVDSDFIESEWHITNLEQFAPQEAAEIKRRIELKAPKPTEKPTPEEKTPLPVNESRGTPEILTPNQGTVIPAQKDTVAIEGTAPENTMQIVVNGYTLTRFSPGDRKWRYFGSTKFGTLIPGENTYTVVAVFRDGTKSDPVSLTITYEGNEESTEQTGSTPSASPTIETSVIQSTIKDFKSPVVIRPAAISPGEVYQTSADSFTITGLVDPKTNRVLVDGYQLRKFKPGDTEFRYTVNSKVANPNLVPGENTYTITAFGPDDKKATTVIKVHYTPLSFPRP